MDYRIMLFDLHFNDAILNICIFSCDMFLFFMFLELKHLNVGNEVYFTKGSPCSSYFQILSDIYLISLRYDCLTVVFLFFYVSGKKLSTLAYFFGHNTYQNLMIQSELPIITVISMCTKSKDVSVLFACMNPYKKFFYHKYSDNQIKRVLGKAAGCFERDKLGILWMNS